MHPYKNRVLATTICGLLSLVVGCGDSGNYQKADTVTTSEPAPSAAAPVFPSPAEAFNPDKNNDGELSDEELAYFIDSLPPAAAGMPPPEQDLEQYRVVVSGTQELLLPGNKGLLNVWIGDEQFQPAPVANMSSAETDIKAVGTSAIIIADAPDFEVSPAASECVLLDPSGVNTKFYLSPKHKGEYTVSATVKLYHSNDCTGSVIPKTANTLSVAVIVNEARIKDELKQFY